MPQLAYASLTIPPAGALNNAARGADIRQIAAAGARSLVPLVYGEDRIGALILNVLPADVSSPTLLVQCLWAHAGDSIADVRLNDQALPDGSTVTHFTGSQVTAAAALVTAFSAQGISYTDTLAGYMYTVVAMPTRSFEGQLNITARVRGRRLYDPRLDGTAGGIGLHRLNDPATWAWSDNPSLALADYLASTLYGAGVAVRWASVAPAANGNDALIGDPPEKRRTLGVSLVQAGSIADVSEALRAYAGCWIVPTATGLSLLPDADAAAVASYSHASGQIADISPLQLRDLGSNPTAVEVFYTDTASIPWREASATAMQPGAGTTRPWRLSQVRLPGVARYSQALREAVERLNKLTLQDLSARIEVFDVGVQHELGDILTITHPVGGLSAKKMRVTGVDMPGPGRWSLGVTEHDPAVYSENVETVPSTADTSFVNPAGAPAAPTGLRFDFEPFGVRFFCNRSPELDVVAYQWRVGATLGAAQVLERNGGTSYLWAVQTASTIIVWVAAVDSQGNTSPFSSMSIIFAPGAVLTLTAVVVAADLQLDYISDAGSFAIGAYELRHGTSFASATVIGQFQATRHTRRVDWLGLRRWWVAAVDVKGNIGAGKSIDVTIAEPGVVGSRRADVVDNNVLLYWTKPTTGSLPVDRYEVRKGATWAGGSVVGSNGNSTFSAVFETASGNFTYWIAAFDSAGNQGTPAAISATVNQPPDYVLRVSYDSPLTTGTLSNMYIEDGAVIGPVNTSQTWTTHYTANLWNTPQEQIDAGRPLYAMPSLASGTYEEIYDYGAVLSATVLTVSAQTTPVAGSVTVSCQISRRRIIQLTGTTGWVNGSATVTGTGTTFTTQVQVGDVITAPNAAQVTVLSITNNTALVLSAVYAGTTISGQTTTYPWTAEAAGFSSLITPQFRYVRVVLTFTGAAGANLISLDALNLRLAAKLKTASGKFVITNATAGVVVPFNGAFIDADTPIAQADGLVPRSCVVDFAGGANPVNFTVFIYSQAGAKVTGSGSWTARGY